MNLKDSLEEYHNTVKDLKDEDLNIKIVPEVKGNNFNNDDIIEANKESKFSKLLADVKSGYMWKNVFKDRTRKLKDRRSIRAKSVSHSGGFKFVIGGRKINIDTAKLFKYGSIAAFLGIVLMTLGVSALFAWYAKDLPQPDKIMRKDGYSTKIFDRNDQLLYEVFSEENRTHTDIDNVSKDFINATIATEDKNFYEHQGFDPLGYARIVYNVLLKGRVIGGSTLTQQIVKNVLLSSDRTIVRKMKELILAIQIEQKYNKDDILQIYINEVPYGGTAWGVYAAAEMYFDKEPKDLNLIESAILAGMPQSPSYYSPYGANPDAFKWRTKDVLRRMREDGYITETQEREAIDDIEKVQFKDPGGSIKAPHFVMYVKSILEERYGENLVQQGGLTVKTSLDLKLHDQVQEIVSEEISNVEESYHITNGAVMVMDPNTGEILSMVGSKDYFADDYDGKVNVTTSSRQPGSSIKPLIFATALKKGFTPESMIMDVKTEFPGVSKDQPYVPKNYSGKFVGPVSLRNALGSSLNIPAVKLLAMVGVEDMMQLGYEMGLPSFKPTKDEVNRLGLSVALGGGEVTLHDLTTAYSAFANGGKKVDPVAILKVEDRNGKVLEEYQKVHGKQVLSEEEAFMISHMLSDNNARLLTFGANSLLNINWRTVAVKTGTTDEQRDNWAIGWDPNVIVGVWVGNNDNTKMKTVASGVSGASPIWRRSILAALEGVAVKEFEMPSGIESIRLDKVSGYPAHDDFESKEALIIKGSKPTGEDPIHVKLKVCRGQDDKLAPESLIAKGEYDDKEFFAFKENDPLFGSDDNHWQKGIDEWTAGMEDRKYHPPTEECEASDDVVVNIEEPGDHSKLSNKFDMKVKVGTSGDVDRVEFYANGDKKGEVKDYPYKYQFDLGDGVYELKAKAIRKDGKSGDKTIKVGVNKDWDWVAPTPTPTPTPAPEASGGASLNVKLING